MFRDSTANTHGSWKYERLLFSSLDSKNCYFCLLGLSQSSKSRFLFFHSLYPCYENQKASVSTICSVLEMNETINQEQRINIKT
jgi:hypothetical protein